MSQSSALSFLSLPGEIRNLIYYQLLLIPALSRHRLLNNSRVYPQILSACHQIHSEAVQILYGENTFLAHTNLLTGLPRLRLCYDSISSRNLISLIRKYHIRIRLDTDPTFTTEQTREAFTGVEELTIEVFEAQFGSSDSKVLRLFEGIRDVKAASIYGSITEFPEYVEWLQNSMMKSKDEPVSRFELDLPDPQAEIWSIL